MKIIKILQILKSTFSFSQTLAWVILASACSGQKGEDKLTSENQIPELVLIDSLVIDRLVQPYLIDVKDDGSEFLLFDRQSDEFLRVNAKGDILFTGNRSGDGNNSYQSKYFIASRYLSDDEILVFTNSKLFRYSLDFELLESKELGFIPLASDLIVSRGVSIIGKDQFFIYSAEKEDVDKIIGEDSQEDYPYLTIRDLESFSVVASQELPINSQMRVNPGRYLARDPFFIENENEFILLFPVSPDLYLMDKNTLEVKKSFSLNPGNEYKQMQPGNPEINADPYFKDLTGSNFNLFSESNGYYLFSYEGAAPEEAVDPLPRNIIGGKEYMEVYKKYKSKNYYMIFKDDQKLWEGTWPITLESKKGFLYSVNAKMGEDPDALERDVQTFYFYELR